MPARTEASLAVRAASPFLASESRTTPSTASSGSPTSPATAPSAIMFGRPPSISLAIFLNGMSAQRAPLAPICSGKSPPSGSPSTRPSEVIGISAEKRPTFCQSIATSTSKWSSCDCTGDVDSRIIAAASPPRICAPDERVM